MDLFRERSSCLAVRFFTAVTLALSYKDQAEGFATLTKSGAHPPLHAHVSSKLNNMVAVFQESLGTNRESAFAGFLPVSPSSWRAVTGGARGKASQQKSSHWQFLSDLKGAPFGTLKWHKHRVVLRSVGEECGLLYLVCLALWCAVPWTSCAGMVRLCHAKANISWPLCMSGDQDCSLGSNLHSLCSRRWLTVGGWKEGFMTYFIQLINKMPRFYSLYQ